MDDYLATDAALATSKKLGSEFLFPTRKGKMATRNLDLAGMTKRALVRAGIIDHWDLRCRRKGCGFVERRMERADGVTCPKCQMRLWPKAIAPRSICFKTLRATFGTVACEVAGGTDFAKAVLGHASQKTTEKHYIASRAARLHDVASKVSFGVKPPASTEEDMEERDVGDDRYGIDGNTTAAPAGGQGADGGHSFRSPATYPALTRGSAETISAGTPIGFSEGIPAVIDGGVYGTRTRGLRRDRPAL